MLIPTRVYRLSQFGTPDYGSYEITNNLSWHFPFSRPARWRGARAIGDRLVCREVVVPGLQLLLALGFG